jgi:hypothetical protein
MMMWREFGLGDAVRWLVRPWSDWHQPESSKYESEPSTIGSTIRHRAADTEQRQHINRRISRIAITEGSPAAILWY